MNRKVAFTGQDHSMPISHDQFNPYLYDEHGNPVYSKKKNREITQRTDKPQESRIEGRKAAKEEQKAHVRFGYSGDERALYNLPSSDMETVSNTLKGMWDPMYVADDVLEPVDPPYTFPPRTRHNDGSQFVPQEWNSNAQSTAQMLKLPMVNEPFYGIPANSSNTLGNLPSPSYAPPSAFSSTYSNPNSPYSSQFPSSHWSGRPLSYAPPLSEPRSSSSSFSFAPPFRDGHGGKSRSKKSRSKKLRSKKSRSKKSRSKKSRR